MKRVAGATFLDPRAILVWFLAANAIVLARTTFGMTAVAILSELGIVSLTWVYRRSTGATVMLSALGLAVAASAAWTLLPTGIAFSRVLLRWSVVIGVALTYFTVIRSYEFLWSIRILKVPESVVIAMSAGLRFLPVAAREFRRVILAQRARGLGRRVGITSVLDVPIAVRALLVPLFLGVLNQATEVWIALQLRGYELAPMMEAHRFRIIDWVVVASSTLVACIAFFA